MKKIARVALLLAAVCFVPACGASLQKRTLNQLETNIKRHETSHMRYVNGDASLDADAKNDWKLHYEGTYRVIDTLKKQADD